MVVRAWCKNLIEQVLHASRGLCIRCGKVMDSTFETKAEENISLR